MFLSLFLDSEFLLEYEEEQFGKGEWIEAIRVSGEMAQAYIPLRPFGTYRFRVMAVNEVGKSKPTVLNDIHRTPPAGKTCASFNTVSGSALHIKLNWYSSHILLPTVYCAFILYVLYYIVLSG